MASGKECPQALERSWGEGSPCPLSPASLFSHCTCGRHKDPMKYRGQAAATLLEDEVGALPSLSTREALASEPSLSPGTISHT